MKTRKVIAHILLLCSFVAAQAQGSLMLAGGGGESMGGWSDMPYQWVVEQAANRRIAVLSYSGGQTSWIPDYFMSLGAVRAKNFMITDRNLADAQSTYDSIITYDGVFLKGGDQNMYFRRFEGTKTQQALQEIFERGGVLSGTSAGAMILSSVSYTAGLSSVRPELALRDAYSPQITLAPGMVEALPFKGIADTHVAERGRFARLSAFLAKWYRDHDESIMGIGIDDHTALCIDRNALGTVYGTGAVSLMEGMECENPFDTASKMLSAAPLSYSQLLHGCSVDFKNGSLIGLTGYSEPDHSPMQAGYTLLFSGTGYPSSEAYEHFTGISTEGENNILIITGMDTARAVQVRGELLSRGAASVEIIQAMFEQGENEALAGKIQRCSKFFLIENQYQDLLRFLNWTGNGNLLRQRITSAGAITFLAGDDARFAGETVVEGCTDPGFPSYHGELEFRKGLDLIPFTTVISNTFVNDDYVENAVTGVPYAVVLKNLRYGIFLTGNTFASYGPSEEGITCFHNLGGSYPLVLLENPATSSDLAAQGPHELSRNIAGFGRMYLYYMPTGQKIIASRGISHAEGLSEDHPPFRVYPNPARDWLFIDIPEGAYRADLVDLSGRVQISKRLAGPGKLHTGTLHPGPYLLLIGGDQFSGTFYRQIVLLGY